MIQSPSLRRALAASVLAHAIGALVGWFVLSHAHRAPETVDIEVAPPPPPVEALPAEVATPPQEDLAAGATPPGTAPGDDPADPESSIPSPPREAFIDAGVDAALADAHLDASPDGHPDAPRDARPDAPRDARPDAPRDASIDARPDAAIDAPPDAAIDAQPDAELDVASTDAGPPKDASRIALADAAPPDAPSRIALADATPPDASRTIAASDLDAGSSALASAGGGSGSNATKGSGAGSGDGSGAGIGTSVAAAGSNGSSGTGLDGAGSSSAGTGSGSPLAPGGTSTDQGALATQIGSGAGIPGATDEPGVDGAPTTAGTAANLLAYFPKGHVVTALIRFDRLRGTEWADSTERLMRPMPDYQLLFGGAAPGAARAKLADTLDTLVISTPRPRDAAATTLVGHTHLDRAALRDFLSTQPVKWSSARGGLLGTRSGKRFPGDQRVFLSPFKGWFLLAQPDDLPGLTAPARGDLDAVEATGKLPPWLAGIRKIEAESGDPRGPALVVTIQLDTKRIELGDNDFGLGVSSSPLPDRASVAVELAKRGWLVRGNLRFGSPAAAAEFVANVQRAQQRIADSHAIQMVVGKSVVRVVANLSFARTGPRVSYATSISIADARAILAAAAAQLDAYYGRAP